MYTYLHYFPLSLSLSRLSRHMQIIQMRLADCTYKVEQTFSQYQTVLFRITGSWVNVYDCLIRLQQRQYFFNI